MKKIIMLLCFTVNVGLVASAWKPLPAISRSASYMIDLVTNILNPVARSKGEGLFELAYKHCLELDTHVEDQYNVIPEKMYDTFHAFVNVGYKFGYIKGMKDVGFKDAFMNVTMITKGGCLCVGALAAFGAVSIAFAIKNKLRPNNPRE